MDVKGNKKIGYVVVSKKDVKNMLNARRVRDRIKVIVVYVVLLVLIAVLVSLFIDGGMWKVVACLCGMIPVFTWYMVKLRKIDKEVIEELEEFWNA